jgi:hypothetical protein
MFPHKVPSLSNVGMRWAGDTKSGEPSCVTAVTKFRIACLIARSFYNGSAPPDIVACACAAGGREIIVS